MSKIVKFIIFVIVILLIVWILWQIEIQPKTPPNVVTFESIKDQMKTGDVITMNTANWLKRTVITNYLGCDCVHVGMVVRMNRSKIENTDEIIPPLEVESGKGELYLLEIGPYATTSDDSDVRFTPLEEALRTCSHKVFGWVQIEREMNITDQDLLSYRDIRYNYLVPTMFMPYRKYKVCSTFIAKIHADKSVGISHEDSHIVTPCDYYNSGNRIDFILN